MERLEIDALITSAIRQTYLHLRWLALSEVEEAQQRLIACGSHPAVVARLVSTLTRPVWTRRLMAILQHVPLQTLIAAERDLSQYLAIRQSLTTLLQQPAWATYGREFQVYAQVGLFVSEQSAASIMAPILDSWAAVAEQDALVALLDPRPNRSRRRPSAETVLMVLLAEHFRKRAGKPHYREIGQAMAVLAYPPSHPPGGFTAKHVKDRIREFRKAHGETVRLWQALKINIDGNYHC